MKTIAILAILLFSYQSPVLAEAACKCNCDNTDITICASSYDNDHPCNGACPTAPARTACPSVKLYNQFKGVYEWYTFCTD